jgi:hypothetical protein
MPTNLLHDINSFTCNDLSINKSIELDNFILTHDYAINDGANVFRNNNVWTLSFNWGYFHELLFWDENERKAKVSWLSQIQQEFLMHSFNEQPTTPLSATTISEVNLEFPNNCNGLIGCEYNPKPQSFVWNIESYQLFVFNFYKSHPELIDWQQNVILPNLKFSNQFIIQFIDGLNLAKHFDNDDEKLKYFSEDYIRSLAPGPGNDRESFLLTFGKKIIESNYYFLDNELSNCEQRKAGGSRRKVYRPLQEGINFILSQDFENGLLEVCDYHGNHLKVLNFIGIKKGDGRADHNLRCL